MNENKELKEKVLESLKSTQIISDKFDEYEKSKFSQDALNDVKAQGFDISVFDQVRAQSASEQEARRKNFHNKIRALVCLMRQALPFREAQ